MSIVVILYKFKLLGYKKFILSMFICYAFWLYIKKVFMDTDWDFITLFVTFCTGYKSPVSLLTNKLKKSPLGFIYSSIILIKEEFLLTYLCDKSIFAFFCFCFIYLLYYESIISYYSFYYIRLVWIFNCIK